MNYLLIWLLLQVTIFDAVNSERLICAASGIMCPSGFRQHKRDCIDIDECEEDPCPAPLTQCVNTPGSYYCQCKEGFEYKEENGICYPKECEANWEKFGLNCYQMPDTRNYFDDAELDCQSKGGHIMSISNLQEKYYYELITGRKRAETTSGTSIMWTGLARQGNKTDYTAFYSDKLQHYLNWTNGEPYAGVPLIEDARIFYGQTDPQCGLIWGVGSLEYCDEWWNFRCQRDKDAAESCGDWHEVRGYCYHSIMEPGDEPDELWMPYPNATAACEELGGRLPVFKPDDDVEGLDELGIAGWLGLESNGRPYDPMIAQMGELFRWTDGTPYEHGVIYIKEFDMDERNINIAYFQHTSQEPYYNPGLASNSLYYVCEKPL